MKNTINRTHYRIECLQDFIDGQRYYTFSDNIENKRNALTQLEYIKKTHKDRKFRIVKVKQSLEFNEWESFDE